MLEQGRLYCSISDALMKVLSRRKEKERENDVIVL